MLKSYPRYKRGELELVFKKLKKQEKDTLNDFLETISANDNKKEDIKRSIVQFRQVIGKPFKEINKDDLNKFIPLLDKSGREKYTINGIKIHIKRFLKYVFDDWFTRFDNLNAIHCVTDARNEKKINSKHMLKKEQIESIIKAEPDFRRKAFFLTLYESAIRPIELRLLKWGDITFHKDLTEIQIYATKTGKARVSFVDKATFYLEKLERGSKDDYVFPSREGDNQPITKETAYRWISKMGKRVGLEVYPYLLRHSRATELHELVNSGKMSSSIAAKIMGHSEKTFLSYGDLDQGVIKELMKSQMYNFEEIPPEQRDNLIKQHEELLTKHENLIKLLKKKKVI